MVEAEPEVKFRQFFFFLPRFESENVPKMPLICMVEDFNMKFKITILVIRLACKIFLFSISFRKLIRVHAYNFTLFIPYM